MRKAAQALIVARYMLAEDMDTVTEQAAQRYDSLIAMRAEVPAATDDD